MELDQLREKWNRVVSYVSANFADGEEMDLDGILFLIGLNELGKGHQKLKKDQKMDVMHIAICSLLSQFDYYTYEGHDEEGWPHYSLNEKLPPLKPGQQALLMKEAIVMYFEAQEVI